MARATKDEGSARTPGREVTPGLATAYRPVKRSWLTSRHRPLFKTGMPVRPPHHPLRPDTWSDMCSQERPLTSSGNWSAYVFGATRPRVLVISASSGGKIRP
jgi:hypothetical protein